MSERYKAYTIKQALEAIRNQLVYTCEGKCSVKFSRVGAAVIAMDNAYTQIERLPQDAIITVDMEAER